MSNVRWGKWEKTMNLKLDPWGALMQQQVRYGRPKVGSTLQHLTHTQRKWVKIKKEV